MRRGIIIHCASELREGRATRAGENKWRGSAEDLIISVNSFAVGEGTSEVHEEGLRRVGGRGGGGEERSKRGQSITGGGGRAQRLILPGEKSIYSTRGVYERPHGRKVRRLEATYNRSWIKFHGRNVRSWFLRYLRHRARARLSLHGLE